MIWIQTTMDTLCFEPHELRSIGTEATRDCRADGTVYNERNYIVFTLKNGERHLISVGDEMLTAIEIQSRLTSAISESVNQKNQLTEINLDQMIREAGDPPFRATRSIRDEEAEQILAAASSQKKTTCKAIRTNLGQICIENADEVFVSTALAWFLFSEDEHETGVLSKQAYTILDRARFCSEFFSEEKNDNESISSLQLGEEFFVMIRTKRETYLILTGERAEDNDRVRRTIEDGLLGTEPLIDLREKDATGPRIMSHDAAQIIMKFLYEYGESPILP